MSLALWLFILLVMFGLGKIHTWSDFLITLGYSYSHFFCFRCMHTRILESFRKFDILTLNVDRPSTTQIRVASRLTGTVMLWIGSANLGISEKKRELLLTNVRHVIKSMNSENEHFHKNKKSKCSFESVNTRSANELFDWLLAQLKLTIEGKTESGFWFVEHEGVRFLGEINLTMS